MHGAGCLLRNCQSLSESVSLSVIYGSQRFTAVCTKTHYTLSPPPSEIILYIFPRLLFANDILLSYMSHPSYPPHFITLGVLDKECKSCSCSIMHLSVSNLLPPPDTSFSSHLLHTFCFLPITWQTKFQTHTYLPVNYNSTFIFDTAARNSSCGNIDCHSRWHCKVLQNVIGSWTWPRSTGR